jgi:3-oxoacyl-[acyl-carrier-protein] synthase-3
VSARNPGLPGAGIGITGAGRALGSRVQTNEELCACSLGGTTPEWIVEKTGIRRRFLLGPGESASTLQLAASRAALERAGVAPAHLGLIVVNTFSGEYLFPPSSARLHRDLGARGAQVYDVQANCAGMVTALTAASDRMRLDPELRHALVVGAEVLSPFVNPADVDTAPYFSDGAGAVVLSRVEQGKGIVASAFHTDTSNFESVRQRGGGSAFPAGTAAGAEACHLEQNGLATWKQAVTHLPPTVRRACQKGGLSPEDVDRFVFHQANLHIIRYAMGKLHVPEERAFVNVQEVGNTGAASIAVALAEALERGAVSSGDRVVLAGVGAGFHFAASLWEWA